MVISLTEAKSCGFFVDKRTVVAKHAEAILLFYDTPGCMQRSKRELGGCAVVTECMSPEFSATVNIDATALLLSWDRSRGPVSVLP